MEPFVKHRVGGATDRRTDMFQKVLTVVLVGAALATAACNTVRGAARDVNSVANCTENAINGQKAC
jgi:predicted small secreted protein